MNIQSLPSTKVLNSAEDIWGINLVPAGCNYCQQAYLTAPGNMGRFCPNCGKAELISQPARIRPEPPEMLIPFKIRQKELTEVLTKFTKGVWLHTDDFNPQNLLQRIIPAFLPMWLVDSKTSGDWQAEVGYDYQVKSSKESYGSGQWRTQEVIRTRIRWESRLGQLNRQYENIPVPAMSDHSRILRIAGNYLIAQAIPYSPKNLGKASLRIPDLQPENAWHMAKSSLIKEAAKECQVASNGQHTRNFALNASYDELNWTQLLLPVYTTYYLDDNEEPQIVYINGQSGKVDGLKLSSQRKGWIWAGIIGAIAVGTFLLGLLLLSLGTVVPPLAIIGPILVILAFVIGCGAIIPAAWPWQWNRKQQEQKIIQY
jgi:hypothetical protein